LQLAIVGLVLSVSCAWLGGCGDVFSGSGASDSDFNERAVDRGDLRPVAGDEANETPGSVGDVALEEPGDASSVGWPSAGAGELRVSIRNSSDVVVDVTVLFIRDDVTVHLTFVQVLPGTVSVAVSPLWADVIRLRAVTSNDVALATVTLRYGRDFDESSPAVFEIDDSLTDPPGDESTSEPAQDPQSGELPEESTEPPSIELLEPDGDLTVTLGTTIPVRWTDASELAGAVIVIWVEPDNAREGMQRVQVSPAVAEHGDGINDEIHVLVQGLQPGRYRVVGEISAGGMVARSIAPGRINVFLDPDNEAPTIDLRSPTMPVRINSTGVIEVSWDDSDSDDNALIALWLESSQTSLGRLSYRIGPSIAEDPDGAVHDSARLVVWEVLPGLYDLVATIDDGELAGASRIPSIVEVLPQPDNDPPTITLEYPLAPVEVAQGGAFHVIWRDADENDNAIISLLLDSDPDGVELDGDEILLVSSIAEDPDGAGNDEVWLGLRPETPVGEYRVVATITDGTTEDISFAPGIVRVVAAGGGPDPSPSIEIVGAGSALFLRHGDRFDCGGVVRHARDYMIRIALVNELARIEATHASEQFFVEGGGWMFTVDTAKLDIPNELNVRSFDIEASLHIDGRCVDVDVERALVWVRQEVEIRRVEVVGIDCGGGHGDPVGPPEAAGVSFTWYGGGFVTDVEVPASVEFWLTKDGVWPPRTPPGETLDHQLILLTVESPGVIREEFVPWETIAKLEPGYYALVALVRHPVYGEIVHVPYLELIEVCPIVGRASSLLQP